MIYSINGNEATRYMVAKKPSTETGRFCLVEREGGVSTVRGTLLRRLYPANSSRFSYERADSQRVPIGTLRDIRTGRIHRRRRVWSFLTHHLYASL
jgi:hypothetical protein